MIIDNNSYYVNNGEYMIPISVLWTIRKNTTLSDDEIYREYGIRMNII